MIYAKIDNTQTPNVVINIQVLASTDYMDPSFTWVDVTTIEPMPTLGDTYSNSVFSAGSMINTGVIDTTQSYLKTGTASTFSPFTINGSGMCTYSFNVSIDGDILTIGCQQFEALWVRYVLYQILTLLQPQFQTMTLNPDTSITWGSFTITNADCVSILTALETINFFA